MAICFNKELGRHSLGDITGGLIRGTYVRMADKVSIVSLVSVSPGKGNFSRFLDDLPIDETIEFDNVVEPIVSKALAWRGWQDHTGTNDWIRRSLFGPMF